MPAPTPMTLSRKLRALELKLKRATRGQSVSFEVKTNTALAATRSGSARCGVAEIDITPLEQNLAMAGYSLAGKIAKGTRYPLFARAHFLFAHLLMKSKSRLLDTFSQTPAKDNISQMRCYG